MRCVIALVAFSAFLCLITADAQSTVTLRSGIAMPTVLLGTGYMSGYLGRNASETAYLNVKSWLAHGGRGIDTAYMYNCQEGIGRAIGESGLDRESLFVLSKVPGTLGYDETVQRVMDDMKQLDTRVDIVLLHWCGNALHLHCTTESIQDSWRALEDLHKNGTLRSIGISNFCDGNLDDLLKTATITPHVHQIERHPGFAQTEMVQRCQKLNITVQGYGPLGDPDRCDAGKELMEDATVAKIASTHGIRPGQVLLAWQTQQGQSVTPRVEKNNTAHILDNLAVMDSASFPQLTQDDIAALDAIQASSKCWPVGVCK